MDEWRAADQALSGARQAAPEMTEEEALAERGRTGGMSDDERRQALARAALNVERAAQDWAERAERDRRQVLDAVVDRAVKATGMTREQLLAEAESLPAWPDAVEPVRPPLPSPRVLMKTAGVDELHIANCGDKEPEDCAALAAVRALVRAKRGHILVLAGKNDVGKTGTACWMLGQVAGGVYQGARGLLELQFRHRDKWERLRDARAVVLDDLGTEDVNDAFRGALSELVNAWYARLARVIITTNLSNAEFNEQKYGPRITGRLAERGRWVVYRGPSRRVRTPAKP